MENKLEWLKERQRGIGGSDIGAILGVSKWKDPFSIYLDKTEEIQEEEIKEESEVIYWGNQFEEVVAKEFERRTGKKVRRDARHFQHKKYPYMVANIDRKVVGENAILECKTANQFLAKEWEGEEIPPSYLLQVQHYLSVTGAEKGYIACLIGGQKFVWKEIQRDEELINIIESSCYDFWNNHVIPRVPPTLNGSEAATKFVNDRYNNSNGLTINLESRFIDELENYKVLKEQLKGIEEQVKEIENNIKLELSENEAGEVSKFKVTWKPIKSNRVDSKALKEKYPEVYKDVIKASTYRKFTVAERAE